MLGDSKMGCSKESEILNHTFSILLHTSLIFCFLVTFFFVYVRRVENNSFLRQMSFVADSLYEDIHPSISNITKTADEELKNDLKEIVKNKLTLIVGEIKEANKKERETIDKHNNKLRMTSIKWALIIIVCTIILGLSARLIGYCLPIWIISFEGIILVGVVALTEFLFLLLVGGRYLAVDPNVVKHKIAVSLNEYAKKNI